MTLVISTAGTAVMAPTEADSDSAAITASMLLLASTEAARHRTVTAKNPTRPPSVRKTTPPAAVIEPTRSNMDPSKPHSFA